MADQGLPNRRWLIRRLLAAPLALAAPSLLAACGGAGSGAVQVSTAAPALATTPGATTTGASTTGARTTGARTAATSSTSAESASVRAATAVGSASRTVAAAPATLTYLHWFTPQLPGGIAQQPLLDQFAKDFPAIKVNSQPTPGGNAYYEKLLTMVAGGVPPDLLTVALFELAPLQSRQVLAPLDSFANQPGAQGLDKQDIVPGVLEAATLGGSLFGLPMNLDTFGLYYNQALFEKVGVGTPTAEWTWEGEWLQAARKLTGGSNATKQFGTSMPPWQIRVWAQGGDILSPDARTCLLDQPPATQAIQDLADLRHKYGAAPQASDLSSTSNDDLFNTGRLAMHYSQSSQIGRLRVTWKTTVPWDIAPLPKGAGGPANWMTFTALGITRTSKVADTAWTFGRFLVAPESVRTWVQYVSWVFMYKSTVNIISPLFKPGQAQLFLDAAAHAHTEPRIANYSEVLTAINKEMSVVLDEGKETAKAATTTMCNAVKPLL